LKEHVDGEVLDVHTELLLLYAARVQHITQVIKPTLNQGGWVLCDRFELSTIAYQGGGRGIPSEIIAQLSQWCLQGFSPDITFFLDIDPEQGLHRVSQRGQVDRIESESLAFFNKVHQAYHDALSTMKNVVIIDAGRPLKTVQESIIAELDRLFK
jgi:dTMP kinase